MIELQTKKELTHKKLCKIAQDYLAGHRFNCPVVVTELSCYKVDEIPDALGFQNDGRSILIECKVSKADYLADRKKLFRQAEYLGMGNEMYFLIPYGVIEKKDYPEKWGVLIYHPGGMIRMEQKPECFETNKAAEVALLTAVVRRLKLSTAVYVQPINEFSDNFEMQGKSE
jgi:hypothetical protein